MRPLLPEEGYHYNQCLAEIRDIRGQSTNNEKAADKVCIASVIPIMTQHQQENNYNVKSQSMGEDVKNRKSLATLCS